MGLYYLSLMRFVNQLTKSPQINTRSNNMKLMKLNSVVILGNDCQKRDTTVAIAIAITKYNQYIIVLVRGYIITN